MPIELPTLIESKLSGDAELRAAVFATAVDFERWLSDSKLPFFSEYTDHGTTHVAGVLETAAGLMTHEARKQFTPGDAAVLTVAALLHDSAMHMSEYGFLELLRGTASGQAISTFDTNPWGTLWDDFIFAARRWDSNKLVEVFGCRPASVRNPLDSYDNLSDTDRKLIGEFIRRHHSRIAHEFAVFGVPSPTRHRIRIDSHFQQDLCDICGLVARSHGLPVRACLDYLSAKYHRREYQGIHAVYLMVLLRVADYLQIQADRAPAIAFRYRRIRSRASRREWEAHNAVKNITHTHDDPESIEIQARPENARTFLHLKRWLDGFQQELDSSWAVLGEVYGAHRGLRQLGIIIRRVRSNLDDVEAFSETVTYVPKHIRLDVARGELLKVLVRPLYANNPSFGIRELVQNAVDAVREIHELEKNGTDLSSIKRVEQDADVEVWLDSPDESGNCVLTISDRGIGMDDHVICNYFLRVGASYRFSHDWQKLFEQDTTEDEEPSIRSRVARSGRFGVGVLAAFLLGDTISVTSRHVKASRGVAFETTVDLDEIELRYDDTIPVGTVVKIDVPQDVCKQLMNSLEDWDWYAGRTPSVTRSTGRPREKLSSRKWIPDHDQDTPFDWRRIVTTHFPAVFWTNVPQDSILFCNGIRIEQMVEWTGTSYRRTRLKPLLSTPLVEINVPNIAVVDPDANLPLNLERTRLAADRLPFEKELLEDIIRDWIAFLLVHTPDALDVEQLSALAYPGCSSALSFFGGDVLPYVFTATGISYLDSQSMARQGITRLIIVGATNKGESKFCPLVLKDGHGLMVALTGKWFRSESWFRAALDLEIAGIKPTGIRVLVPQRYSPWDPYKTQDAMKSNPPHIEWATERWLMAAVGECDATCINMIEADQYEEPDFMLMECFVNGAVMEGEDDVLSRLWSDIISQAEIPFNVEDRRKGLARAYQDLAPYIDSLERELAVHKSAD